MSVGNISLHFQTLILPLIVIIQWDLWFTMSLTTAISDLIIIWNDLEKQNKLKQTKSRRTVATSPRHFKRPSLKKKKTLIGWTMIGCLFFFILSLCYEENACTLLLTAAILRAKMSQVDVRICICPYYNMHVSALIKDKKWHQRRLEMANCDSRIAYWWKKNAY